VILGLHPCDEGGIEKEKKNLLLKTTRPIAIKKKTRGGQRGLGSKGKFVAAHVTFRPGSAWPRGEARRNRKKIRPVGELRGKEVR